MSDVVIRARDLRKVYRLYSKSHYRFLDMFGLLGRRTGAYTEHAALDGVSLDIARGEKVAVIGRNGAGKSTFLKLVTHVIEPTTGTLTVNGKVHALLQIGTGFHPDFTGRDNVYAYLAQLGVTGAEAIRRCDEIIEFSELEQYIDQPVKTYSTGMAVRLMFSTSTAIIPDLLVLDEVLGVGDAYFSHKSYERIRELCDREGTTLLLVTHDIYSAIDICPRVIWIDRGRVLMDGDGSHVVQAYEDSIRHQEEERLRLRAQVSLGDAGRYAPDMGRLMVEVHAVNNEPQPCPVYFSGIEIVDDGRTLAALSMDESTAEAAHFQLDGSAWGPAAQWQGRWVRALLNYGSPFHKVAAAFDLPPSLSGAQRAVRLTYWSDQPCALSLHAFRGSTEIPLGLLPASAGAWTEAVIPLTRADGADMTAVRAAGGQGTGAIWLSHVVTRNGSGEPAHIFEHGTPLTLEASFDIHDPTLREFAQVLVAFHRDGVQDVCRLMVRDLVFDAAGTRRGIIRMRVPRLFLGVGTYTVTIMVTRAGYFDARQTQFYSINPGVYCSLSRILEIVVEGGGIVAAGTATVLDAEWSLSAGDQ